MNYGKDKTRAKKYNIFCDRNHVPNIIEIIVKMCKYDDDDVTKYIRRCFVFKRFEYC